MTSLVFVIFTLLLAGSITASFANVLIKTYKEERSKINDIDSINQERERIEQLYHSSSNKFD